MNNYYKDMDLKYIEKAICLEKFNIHNPGKLKFYVPALLPLESNRSTPTESGTRVSKNHLVNKNKSKIRTSSSAKTANYVEMDLYNYITAPLRDIVVESEYTGCDAPEGGGQSSPGTITNTVIKSYFYEVDDQDMVDKHKEFCVAFIGGDYNHKKIIGRYE